MRSAEPSDGLNGALFCLAVIAALLPVVSVNVAPLCDFPNHLGRIHVLTHFETDRVWSDFYVRDLAILPNLAMDAIATPLAHVFGTKLAGSLFLMLTVLSVIVGAAAVARVERRSAAVAALLAAASIHSISFEYGFVNYVFGLGWMLCGLAAWIAARRANPVLRIAVSVPFALVIFFSHLMPLAFYAVAVFGYELGRIRRDRSDWAIRTGERLGIASVQFLFPAFLYFVLSPTRNETAAFTWLGPVKKASQLGSVFSVGGGALDYVFTAAFALGVVALILVNRARFSRSGWAVVGGMLLVFALAPQKSATADNISIRVPTAVLLLAVALVRVQVRSPRQRMVCFAVLGALVLFRTGQMTTKWVREAPTYDALSEAFAELPSGTTLFTLRDEFNRTRIRESWHPPMAHAAGLALLETPLYLPQLFAYPGQQPLIVLRPSLVDMRTPRGDFMPTYRSPEDFAAWIDEFARLQQARKLHANSESTRVPAAVFHVHEGPIDDLPTDWVERIASGDRWTLWLITK